MNLLQKFKQIFAKNDNDKLSKLLSELSAKQYISKQNDYRSRAFAADKHIKDWKNAIDEALSPPYFRKDSLSEIVEQVLFDAQVQAQIQTRKNGTMAENFLIDAEEFVKKLLKEIINIILDSIFFWASACELSETGIYKIPYQYLCTEKNELLVGYQKGIPFEAFENLLVFPNPHGHLGLLAFASQYAIYKRFSLSDWSRHSELFGMPFLSLKTPVTDAEEIRKRHQALANFGSNAYVILDTDEHLEAIDTKTAASPYEMYLQMIRFCDEQISKIIVGQVATADQKAFVGSAEVQERILDWHIEADMRYVAETINARVVPFLAKKGLLSEKAVFAWEYFIQKDTIDKGQGARQTNAFCSHQHSGDYEDFLASLKKKVLTSPNTSKGGGLTRFFRFDFEDFWDSEEKEFALFNYYLNALQTPIKDLLNESENSDLHTKFTQNAYEFALAKTATFLAKSKDLSKEEARALFEKMEHYGETEKTQFALAIQSALEWQELLKDKDIFPNLEYRAVMDENTRESHAKLNGIIRPITDAFWQKYYPPIDYRCRCTVRQRDKTASITKNLPANLPAVSAGLDHNPGDTGQAFNEKHPYFDSTSKKALQNVVEYAGYNKEYRKEYFDVKTGGYVVRHKKHTETNWQKNVLASKIISEKESIAIELLEKDTSKPSSADANLDNVKADFKHPKNPKKLNNFVRNSIKNSKKQGDIVILFLPKSYDYNSLYFGFKEYVRFLKKDSAEIAKVIVVTEDKKLVIFNNQDFKDGKWEEKIKFLKR